MIRDISISRSLGNIPEARVVLYDTNEIQAILSAGIATYVYTATLELPDSQPALSITGKITNYTLTPSVGGLSLSFIVLQENSFFDTVHVAAAVAIDLLEDLEAVYSQDDTLVYTIKKGLTSGQIAEMMAQQVGITLEWDSDLDYEVVTLLEPVFYFKGTFQAGIQELLAPFNVGGHICSSVTISTDGMTVSAYRIGVTTPSVITLTPMNIGNDSHLANTAPVRNTVPGLPEYVDYWFCEPAPPSSTRQEVLITKVEQIVSPGGTQAPHGGLLSEIIEIRTLLGNTLLSVHKEMYKDHTGFWGLSSEEDTTYTYDPVPNSHNIFYREDMKLVGSNINRELYSLVEDTHLALEKSEVESAGYTYQDSTDGLGVPTTVLKKETRTLESVFEADSANPGKIVGKISSMLYTQLSDNMLETIKHDTDYVKDETLIPVYSETVLVTTMIKPGSMPAPSNNAVNTEGLMTVTTGEIKKTAAMITGKTASIEFPFNPEANGLVDDVGDRINMQRMECSLTLKSNYDLKEGSWVEFVWTEDAEIKTYHEGVNRTVMLSTIFGLLPPEMMVTSVEVVKSGAETICTVNLLGWR